MNLQDEDTNNIMCRDLPKQEEYSHVLYDAQETGRYTNVDFKRSQEANNRAWLGISDLMARCIARGVRLAKEGKY